MTLVWTMFFMLARIRADLLRTVAESPIPIYASYTQGVVAYRFACTRLYQLCDPFLFIMPLTGQRNQQLEGLIFE